MEFIKPYSGKKARKYYSMSVSFRTSRSLVVPTYRATISHKPMMPSDASELYKMTCAVGANAALILDPTVFVRRRPNPSIQLLVLNLISVLVWR